MTYRNCTHPNQQVLICLSVCLFVCLCIKLHCASWFLSTNSFDQHLIYLYAVSIKAAHFIHLFKYSVSVTIQNEF